MQHPSSRAFCFVSKGEGPTRPWGGYEYASQHRSPPFPHFLLVFRKIGFFSRQSFHKRSYSRLDNGRIIVVKSRISWFGKEVFVYFLSLLEIRLTRRVFISKVISFRLIFIWTFICAVIEMFILGIIFIYNFSFFSCQMLGMYWNECASVQILCIVDVFLFLLFLIFFLYFPLGIYQDVLQFIFITRLRQAYEWFYHFNDFNERSKSNNKYLPFKCKDHWHYIDRF